MASLYFVTFPPYHECSKDSTIDCIINTVPEPAPSLCAKGDLAGMKHCPAESRAI